MTRFEKLLAAIKSYDNEKGGLKATAHHSAVSVRVAEMEAVLGPASTSTDSECDPDQATPLHLKGTLDCK